LIFQTPPLQRLTRRYFYIYFEEGNFFMTDNSKGRDIFVVGLRNIHAIESEALSIMNAQVDRLDKYPALQARIRQHIDETKTQQQRLEQIFSALDEDHSSLKDTAASVMGKMAAMAHSVADDEVLKNSFADFAFENFEIASYKSLITMAETLNQTHALPLLKTSLAEEEAMAAWLAANLQEVTLTYLQRAQSEE
jgi:ferritin-like metal-binding protein YciE